MKNNPKNLAFVLGRESELAYQELVSVLDRFCFTPSPKGGALCRLESKGDIYRISGNIVFAKLELGDKTMADFVKECGSLAGTIKVFEVEQSVRLSGSSLSSFIKRNKTPEMKFNFGISDYSNSLKKEQLEKLGLTIKKQLKPKYRTRFVSPKESAELSSILSLKNDLVGRGIEVGVFDKFIGKLIFLNNPEEWGKRDYGKPKGDKFSGMLPPKLARMLVNITQDQEAPDKTLVVDPFCGSGNIVAEAMMLGLDVFGSDISEKAVSDTQTNLDWLAKEYGLSNKFEVLKADATKFNFKRLTTGDRQLAIVAEPYLGRPKKYQPTFREVESEYLKIKDLYINFLANLKQLATDSRPLAICLIFPLVEASEKRQFSLYSSCVDEIKKMGYTQSRTFIYGRDYQVVKREIVFLKFNGARSGS